MHARGVGSKRPRSEGAAAGGHASPVGGDGVDVDVDGADAGTGVGAEGAAGGDVDVRRAAKRLAAATLGDAAPRVDFLAAGGGGDAAFTASQYASVNSLLRSCHAEREKRALEHAHAQAQAQAQAQAHGHGHTHEHAHAHAPAHTHVPVHAHAHTHGVRAHGHDTSGARAPPQAGGDAAPGRAGGG